MENKKICPEWAKEMIATLRNCEVYLGNIPKDLEWDSQYVKEVAQRSFLFETLPISEQLVELVFKKIVTRLAQEAFSCEEIASLINEQVRYKNSPPYCSAEEVKECLT